MLSQSPSRLTYAFASFLPCITFIAGLLIAATMLVCSENRASGAEETPATQADKKLQLDMDEVNKLVASGKGSVGYIKKVAKDRLEAWKAAAKRGSPIGQYLLGRALEVGAGIPPNPKEAVELFRKAAEQGYATAQRSLGSRYLRGDGVEKDVQEGIAWVRRQQNRRMDWPNITSVVVISLAKA